MNSQQSPRLDLSQPESFTVEEMLILIRVQSLIRGWIQRRKYKVQQISNLNSSQYFKQSEAKETFTGAMFDPNAATETRTFKYSTGAVYQGQWKGGMRHGLGKITWADGTQYEGHWQYNQAYGKGTFKHQSGDVYIG